MLVFGGMQMWGQTYHDLSVGTFSQDWTNTGLITTNDNWTGVPSIIGYRGDAITAVTGSDPQTLLGEGTITIDVIANQTNPNTNISGGIAEFEITDPVVAFQGSGTADAPNIVIYLNTTGVTTIQVGYNLRDVDGSADNAVQPVALQYRVGTTGDFTNIPEAFVADASTGPSLAVLVTPVSITLPSVAENQSQLQLRIITSNAVGSDEWIGIDDIVISGMTGGNPLPSITNITQTPILPLSSQSVSVSADVTDDGTVTGVELHWGTISGSLLTTIAMSVSSGDTYTTDTDIAAQAAETTIYYEIQATDDNSGVSTSSEQSYQVLANEPTNHVTGFTATANSGTTITVSWTDSDAGSYLVKGSFISYDDIVAPVDGVAIANGALVQNVASGTQTFQYTGLTPFTTYYFKVYPYNGSGAAVNYKTDGIVPQQTATTQDIYFRSAASGPWNAFATWEISSDNSSWAPSTAEIPVYINSDVTIQTGHLVTVPLSYYNGAAKNLTVETGATLYANSSTGACFVYVYGDFLNDGTVGGPTDVIGFDIEGTSCLLSGSGSFIAARIAKFTTLNTTTHFTIDQNVTLIYTSTTSPALRNGTTGTSFDIVLAAGKQLTVPNAKIDLTGCTLTLKSDATGTASLIDNGTIDGMNGSNVAVERYITGGVWHDLSASTQNQTVNNLYFNGTPDVWLNSYNEPDRTRIPIVSLDTPLPSGAGFEIWVQSGNNVTVSFDGALRNTDVMLNTTSTNPPLMYSGPEPLGYNLIGNPFACPLDWDLGTWNLTDISGTIWVWDPVAGSYKDRTGGVGGLTDGIIPMGQGFFVQTTSDLASITIPIDARAHSTQPYYKSVTNAPDHLWLKAIKGERNDQLTIVFAEDATEGYDNGRDARKMAAYGGNAPKIYAIELNETFGIDGLPLLTEAGRMVKVMYHVGESGEQQLVANLDLLPDVNVLLEDLHTGVVQDLNENPMYLFEGQEGDDPNRFTLYFNPTALTIQDIGDKSELQVYAFKNDIFIRSQGTAINSSKTIWVYDLYGRVILNTVIPPSTLTKIPVDVKNTPLIVRVSGSGSVVTAKVMIN
jgi:hypothetical protein